MKRMIHAPASECKCFQIDMDFDLSNAVLLDKTDKIDAGGN